MNAITLSGRKTPKGPKKVLKGDDRGGRRSRKEIVLEREGSNEKSGEPSLIDEIDKAKPIDPTNHQSLSLKG